MKRNAGFTLIELVVTIAIAGISLTVAVPAFREMILGNRLMALLSLTK
jgi:type IV fimbrial biogenesis protein FimT